MNRELSSVEAVPASSAESRFLRACRSLPVDATPVWLMRQAGRYMEEYRALRSKYTILEMIKSLNCPQR